MSVKDSSTAPSVICPFYVDDVRLRIRCEGLDGAQYTHRIFEDYNKKHLFMKKNCCSFKRKCSISKELDEQYARQDD